MKTIRINRNKWVRGGKVQDEPFNTYLYYREEPSGKEGACCLGHFIHQVDKCSWSELYLKVSPAGYFTRKSYLTTTYGVYYNTDNNNFADRAMRINDNVTMNEEIREKHLKDLFKEHGFNLEFYTK